LKEEVPVLCIEVNPIPKYIGIRNIPPPNPNPFIIPALKESIKHSFFNPFLSSV
jgi:hypothetical protein